VEQEIWQALIVAPVLARSMGYCIVLLAHLMSEKKGLGSDMAEFLPKKQANVILFVVGLSLLFVSGFWQAMLILVASLLVLSALRWMMMKRIEGMTGDTIGASIEIIEVVVLLSLI